MSQEDKVNSSNSSKDDQPKDGINELEKELEIRNPDIFEGVSEEKKREILQDFVSITMIHEERSHSGPLPSPNDLMGYNKIIPDGADRIMKMAEKQQQHRMGIEKAVIDSQSK